MRTVLFHGNDEKHLSALYLTDIERYPDKSIKSGTVENGQWDLLIAEDGTFEAYRYLEKGAKPVNSWKPIIVKIVEVDAQGDYNDIISAAEKILV